MQPFRFAHLSDPHLPLAPDRPRGLEWLSKRTLSYQSWQRKRRHAHTPDMLAAIVADIRSQGVDHWAVTGDIANISMPGEFTRGAAWLRSLGSAEDVSYVPGNHDAMVQVPVERGLGLWADHMRGDDADPQAVPSFPYLRQRGSVAFIGANSGVPTAPLLATGRLGAAQMERLGDMLADAGRRGLFRVLMVHHPVGDGVVSNRKGLTDRRELRSLLARTGAEILLHGHAHVANLSQVKGPSGPIPSLTAPSASAIGWRHDMPARWHHVTVDTDAGDWRVQVEVRGARHRDGPVTALGGWSLRLPRG
ncbi:metallophosphoesterase family protein [Niveispirillum fermenti]|uniref:metallophosphoesterase family protein n=1 Tax=Niveispirillum fermenti TaxID=1233113 RepID=UPI003A8589FD